MELIRTNMVHFIEDMYNMLTNQALENSIEAICRSRDVVIFGIGSSRIAGQRGITCQIPILHALEHKMN